MEGSVMIIYIIQGLINVAFGFKTLFMHSLHYIRKKTPVL